MIQRYVFIRLKKADLHQECNRIEQSLNQGNYKEQGSFLDDKSIQKNYLCGAIKCS